MYTLDKNSQTLEEATGVTSFPSNEISSDTGSPSTPAYARLVGNKIKEILTDAPFKIFIVDDNDLVRLTLKARLKKALNITKEDILESKSGEDFLKIYQPEKEQIIVVMDYEMGNDQFTGAQTVAKLRALEKQKGFNPAHVIGYSDSSSAKEKFDEVGVTDKDFVPKNPTVLIEKIIEELTPPTSAMALQLGHT